jgi:hypothetical protein
MEDEWVTVKVLEEQYSISQTRIYGAVSHYKKENNKYPVWYIKVNGQSLINYGYFRYFHDLKLDCYRHSTAPDVGIYWKLQEKLSDSQLAKRLSKYSGSSEKSWIQFLSSGLWVIPSEEISVIVEVKATMLEKFLYYGVKILNDIR